MDWRGDELEPLDGNAPVADGALSEQVAWTVIVSMTAAWVGVLYLLARWAWKAAID